MGNNVEIPGQQDTILTDHKYLWEKVEFFSVQCYSSGPNRAFVNNLTCKFKLACIIQGDHSGCVKTPFHIKTKVPLKYDTLVHPVVSC